MKKIKTNLVLIYADSFRRDYSTAALLQNKLRVQGIMSVISCRRNFLLFLKIIHFSKVIVIGQINMFSEFESTIGIAQLNEIIFYPAEGEAADSQYEVMYPKNFDYNLLDKIVFWGRLPMKWFSENRRCNLNKLMIGGYTRSDIAHKYLSIQNNSKTKMIGFIGRFGYLNDLYGRSCFNLLISEALNAVESSTSNGVETAQATLFAEAKTITGYFSLVLAILKYSDYSISFRPHPNENHESYEWLEKYFGSRFVVDRSVDAVCWIVGCEKIIGMGSSIYIDAFFSKTPVISLDKWLGIMEQTIKYNPTLHHVHGGAYCPENFEQALDLALTSKLGTTYNDEFKDLINNNYIGSESPISFLANQVVQGIKKSTIFDISIKYILILIDEIKCIKKLILDKKVLQFDYSIFHSRVDSQLKKILEN